ncbi:RNA-directed DNA polymerase, eukaryota, reverse transcriptase zinc-binding domain protein [Tanacetum coccineum]
MESLHISFARVLEASLYKGISINNSLMISHLFYADDAVFVGKWDISNIKVIVNLLKCFFMASGLKINLHKSKLMGIGVGKEDIDSAAQMVGFIKAIHGVRGAMDSQSVPPRGSIWLDLVREFSFLKLKGIDLLALMKRKLGNEALEESKGISVASKMGLPSLLHSFRRHPRGGVESAQFRDLCDITSDVLLPQMQDRWSWSLNASGVFSVSSVRNFIDDAILPKKDAPTRWVKLVHIKINILAWKIYLDRLPTRLNLLGRGLDIPSILCPLCNEAVESTSHIFFSYSLAHQVMRKVCRWWELDFTPLNSYSEWLIWFSSSRMSKLKKVIFEAYDIKRISNCLANGCIKNFTSFISKDNGGDND